MRYPNFEEKIKNNIVDRSNRENHVPKMAMIIKYYKERNSADIVTARPGSHQMGEIYTGVPCPQTMGVQTVSPEPGRMCWISFQDGMTTNPTITNFFNPGFRENDYDKEYSAVNDIPRFMMDM